ncbi:hypothetical protein [Helicobacter marmotae]|uniref:hypothetical protein n=1 Tax=Helicobacter marmotae TaxID=152490 RepID=UPI001472BC87|nr:hypothetical protein [Helicobacter marmotae]
MFFIALSSGACVGYLLALGLVIIDSELGFRMTIRAKSLAILTEFLWSLPLPLEATN